MFLGSVFLSERLTTRANQFARGASVCENLVARFGAERENDGEFVENDGGIFYEHGIGEIGLGRKRNDASAELFEEPFVSVVLSARNLEIDWLAGNEAQFAIYNGRTDGARDGSEHAETPSLHENSAKD